jgi:hypothetical protein
MNDTIVKLFSKPIYGGSNSPLSYAEPYSTKFSTACLKGQIIRYSDMNLPDPDLPPDFYQRLPSVSASMTNTTYSTTELLCDNHCKLQRDPAVFVQPCGLCARLRHFCSDLLHRHD